MWVFVMQSLGVVVGKQPGLESPYEVYHIFSSLIKLKVWWYVLVQQLRFLLEQ